MVTLEQVIQNAYVELARQAFPIRTGFGEG